MAFIASYWWLWLLLTVFSAVFVAFMIFRVLRGLKTAIDGAGGDEFGKVEKGISQSIDAGSGLLSVKTFMAGMVGGVSGILLIISVILHIIDYSKG